MAATSRHSKLYNPLSLHGRRFDLEAIKANLRPKSILIEAVIAEFPTPNMKSSLDEESHDELASASANHQINNAFTSNKPINHVLNFYPFVAGGNAFRNCHRGGESSENGSVELLSVNQADPDSANTNQQASPAMNNTSSASDQNATASALPENNRDGDEQPPPDRSLSDVERGETSSQTERRNEGTRLDLLKAANKICFIVNGELVLTSATIRSTSAKPLSDNANILLYLAELCSTAGFFLCLGGYALLNTNIDSPGVKVAARLVTCAGSIATSCGFLSFMGTQLPEDIMLWLTGTICVVPISVLPFMFKK